MILKKEFSDLLSFEAFTKEHDVIFFDFYADWCEPCKMLDEIIVELEKDLSSRNHIRAAGGLERKLQ